MPCRTRRGRRAGLLSAALALGLAGGGLGACFLPGFDKVDGASGGTTGGGLSGQGGSGTGAGGVGANGAGGDGTAGGAAGSGSGGGAGGPADACGAKGAGLDAGPGDAGGPDAGAEPCSGHPGPVMAAVPSAGSGFYCIDRTEVTNAHYAEFLGAKPDAAGQEPHCDFNETFVPAKWTWPNPGKEDLPVVNVDWCDAAAYCKWAGKRLCGEVGGGHGPYDASEADPDTEQWYRACSRGGEEAFPYGGEYDEKACNGKDYGAGAAIAAGQAEGCVGGYGCVFDMAGNVTEWVDQCDGYKNDIDYCFALGGSFKQTGAGASCLALSEVRRGEFVDSIGFRCCSDP